MTDDLPKPPPGRKSEERRSLPIARIQFSLLTLIAVGFVARVLMIDDPDGGRPTQ